MRRTWLLPLLAAALAAASCDLPGAAPPTPFVFPTANQTLTAVFAPTATSEAPPPTETPVVEVTVISTIPPLATGAPTATLGTLSSRPNGSVIEATFLASAPTVDGDLGEWSALPYSADKIVFGAARWTGVSDASGVFAAGWDDSYLYLAVRVTDDKYVQTSTGDNMWKGDEVEIQVDANLPTDFYTASLSSDDHQIGLSAGNFGSIAPQAYRWYPQSKAGTVTGASVAGKLIPTGYEIEARIPWSALSVTAVEGARFGFALSISDNDQAGTAAQQSMVSSVSTRKLLNPTTWGTLALGGATPK